MTKDEYLESQRGKTYTQIIAEQPMETVQGSLLKLHYQELKTILGAGGLRLHLQTFVADTPEKQFALSAANETFTEQYMADPDFKVNFTVQKVLDAFNATVALGVIPQEIGQELLDLAKYQRPVFGLTREDCAAYFGPAGWVEIAESSAQRINIQLDSKAPETTSIIVQWQDASGDWYHATAVHGILAARVYQASLPYYGTPRKLRWKCEYMLDVAVTAV